MPFRRTLLRNDHIYHVFNRGVAKQPIFRDKADFIRFIEGLDYYRYPDRTVALSVHRRNQKENRELSIIHQSKVSPIVEILAFCLMPNHFHLLLRQVGDRGISTMIRKLANSYTRAFNTRYQRIGPLLQGPFKAVWIETNEQLMHVSRYIHLNPVVGQICQKPEEYPWSSFQTYIKENDRFQQFCNSGVVLELFPNRDTYQKFVDDHIDYARSLEGIKHAVID